MLWRFVCERRVRTAAAAPAWSPEDATDVDLLARHCIGRGLSRAGTSLDGLTRITIADLVTQVAVVRESVLGGCRQQTWVV